MRYEPQVDVASLKAIDVHVHIEVDDHGHASLPADLLEAASKYFRTDGPRPDLDAVAAFYRERSMAAVVFTVDAQHGLGHEPIPSEFVAEGAARHADVLIPFGSVDPHRPDAVDRARRLIEDCGVQGFKFHPTVQAFDPSEERMGWDDIAGPLFQDLLAEYLAQSSATQPTEELAAFAADAAGRFSPDGAARLICEFLHEQVRYVPGATTVHTPARDAWEAKSGVCQDFAHLAIGALRHVGIPARYVSGYLHPKPDASIGETVRGESHAWVEWWAGDWFGFDPTNDKEVADHHVVVARAREYRDVPPLSGVFAGAGSDLEVSVKVTLLG